MEDAVVPGFQEAQKDSYRDFKYVTPSETSFSAS